MPRIQDRQLSCEREFSLAIVKNKPFLITRIEKNCGLDTEQAFSGLMEVLRFLDLVFIHDQSLTPSKLVDDVWHEFILFTRLYEECCFDRYDRYIHHNPCEESADNQRDFQLAQLYYSRRFGEPNAFFWGNNSSTDLRGACSSCDSK